MNQIKSAAIIGLGAVGAIVAEQLKTVLGNNLYCILDEKRLKEYSENGIYINTIKQDFNYVTPEQLPQVDLILICTKNLQLNQALKEIKNGVGPNTMILSLLNGIQSEKEIAELYGIEKTLFGFIIDLQSINLNRNISCSGKGKIVFGEKNNLITERIKAVQNLFNESGIKYETPENIEFAMWKKFLINVTFNSLGAICRSTYGGFRFESLQSAARKIGFEVVKVANAEGIPLTNELLEEDIQKNLTYDPKGKCSMLQDTEAGRNTENQWFCGTIVKLGKKHGIETPYCDFLRELIDGTEKARTIL